MAQYTKKSFDDGISDEKQQRSQRKHRAHKLSAVLTRSRREDRSGWAYAKRRTLAI